MTVNLLGQGVVWLAPSMYEFKAIRSGSEVMQVPVKLKDGSSKIASVIQVETTTLDSKGQSIKVLLQIDTGSSLYLHVQKRQETFYNDPALPKLVEGIIRTGDVFGFWTTGSFEEFDNANGSEVVKYIKAAIAIHPY